jgi:hypothetical protein
MERQQLTAESNVMVDCLSHIYRRQWPVTRNKNTTHAESDTDHLNPLSDVQEMDALISPEESDNEYLIR